LKKTLLKPAFTLIEVVVSVVLLALMITYLYNALGVLQNSNSSLLSKGKQLDTRDFFFGLLYKDLFEASSTTITSTQSKDFDILKLKTSNSLHNISAPNITYIVVKEDKKLIRIESPYTFALPIPIESTYMMYADEVATNVEFFKIYSESSTENNQSSSENLQNDIQKEVTAKGNVLLSVKLRNQKPLFFEIAR
jgi:prepilin-type N-terminal cleavage/methylation domain-containing protein